MNSVILTHDRLEPYVMLSDYEKLHCDLALSGGQNIFIGYMRKTNSMRSDVASMSLDYYPEMTEKYLNSLRESVINTFKLHEVFIAHRVGNVFPEQCLVIVACWSKHRKESIGAVKHILEDLKHNAPFWKKEYFSDDKSAWVEKNT